ncbi:hypothetical protein VKT23_007906 [Stygiomarasmius scandens]|uniref:Transposase n=1 Tax=Marasmiellus scandens TaxID=2682957 RepID=A0ABR1JNE9_9AGAR
MNRASIIHIRWQQVARQENLAPNTPEYSARRKEYISEELRREFSQAFGVDVDSLEAWKRLCIAIRGEEVKVDELASIKQCKDALQGCFVNIFDLVDAGIKRCPVPARRVFPRRSELAKYTKKSRKIFPKDDAKPVPLLAYFLIELFVVRKPKPRPNSK